MKCWSQLWVKGFPGLWTLSSAKQRIKKTITTVTTNQRKPQLNQNRSTLKSWSVFCVGQLLLSMRSVVEWLIYPVSLNERNCFFLSMRASIISSFLVRGETFCVLLPLSVGLWSVFEFYISCTCSQHPSEFICVSFLFFQEDMVSLESSTTSCLKSFFLLFQMEITYRRDCVNHYWNWKLLSDIHWSRGWFKVYVRLATRQH